MGHKHKHGCDCCGPDALTPEQIAAQEAKWLQEPGWYAHYVEPDKPKGVANFHTHGFVENAKHPDFQIVLHVPVRLGHMLFNILWHMIKGGMTFKDGDVSDKFLHGYDVKFVNAKDGQRDVLRIIMPDEQGRLERDDFEGEDFKLQYADAAPVQAKHTHALTMQMLDPSAN